LYYHFNRVVIGTFIRNTVFLAFCLPILFHAAAQQLPAPGDTILQQESFIKEDTISKKEIRKQKHQLKYEQSGAFFNHADRPGRKAAFYSFGFPGLGQIYNRKYWKLPIVYGVIGTGVYFAGSNGKQLKRLNNALEIRLSGGSDEFDGIYSDAQLTSIRNSSRRNTELSAILSGLAYGLNIIDAVVDAHLFDFDISDDLSFQWHPNLLTGNNKVVPGIQLSLKFN